MSEFLKSNTGTLLLLWGIGLYLRLTVLIAPPLSPLIGQDYGLSQAGMGALTTLPSLLLAVGAIPGSFITFWRFLLDVRPYYLYGSQEGPQKVNTNIGLTQQRKDFSTS